MSALLQDVRFALRTLGRGWGVTLIAVASLAVGIGGNTAVFGLINSLLFQPLAIEDPERVVVMQERRREQPERLSTLATSLPTFADLAERSRGTVAWAALRPTTLGLRGPERSDPINAARVTGGFFELLGVAPTRGRLFLSEETAPGGPRVALVSASWWERTRGGGEGDGAQGAGEPVGEVLVLDGEPHEVVGVVPADFNFLFSNADVWVPLAESPSEAARDKRDVIAVARLAPGTTMEQVRAEISGLAGRLEAEHPAVQRDWTLDVYNARTDIPDARSKTFYALLQGSVLFVLLIACANVTNLLLARGQERRREIALRTVLGAGRGRIMRQLLTESAVLVALGGALGLGLGWLGIRALAARFAGFLPPSYTPALDGRVVLFTLGVSVAAGLAFGLLPARQTLAESQSEALKEGGGKATAGPRRKLLSRGLVVAEIALSLLALGGGGMLVKSFVELRGADPGFDGSGLVTAQVRVPASRYPDDAGRLLLLDEVLERASALRGARSAALVNVLPRTFQTPTDTFRLAGAELDPSAVPPRAFALLASPDYPETLGIEVLQGRFFEPADRPGQPPVAVVNRSFAERWLGGESPLGRRVEVRGETREIVGVVADVQQVLVRSAGQVESEAIYTPAAQSPDATYTVIVRAEGDPGPLKESLRASLQELDPDLTLAQLLTLDEVMDQFFAGIEVFNTILGGFGVLALLLASLGTYGVLAYQVSQRRHEIGIRMAVGARAGEVVRMILRQGVWMALLGLAAGGLALVPLTGLLRSLVEGFATVSPATAVLVAGVLFLVTLAASVVPAARASATDPVRALRDEG